MVGKGNCILCGSKDFELLFEGRDRLTCSENKFKVVKCADCGLMRTLPDVSMVSMADVQKYYPDEYYNVVKDKLSLKISKSEAFFSDHYSKLLWRILLGKKRSFICRAMDFFENLLLIPLYRYRNRCFPYKDKPGRLLDIGCGSGRLLLEQKRLGWEVYGVELGEKMASYAREIRNLNVITGDFNEMKYEDNFFDVVNLHHALEHFLNPLVELKKIYKILKPDSLLVITSPNYSRLEATIFGEKWHAYELPRHRFHFNRKTIKKLLLKSGLKPIGIIQTLNVNNLILSTRYILEGKKASNWIIRQFSIDNKALRFFLLPFGFFLKLIGQSSEMIVYAKKE